MPLGNFVQDFVTAYNAEDQAAEATLSYQCIARIPNIGQSIYCIALSPDGRLYAYGGTSATTAMCFVVNTP